MNDLENLKVELSKKREEFKMTKDFKVLQDIKNLSKTISMKRKNSLQVKVTNQTLSSFNYDDKDIFIIYLHNRYGFFTFVCKRVGNIITIGYSLCNIKDNFSKKLGRELAVKRLETSEWVITSISEDPKTNREYLYNYFLDCFSAYSLYSFIMKISRKK